MNVIFMGTPDFAVNTLKEIVKRGHEVSLVVTQPDKPKGRGKAMQYSPVKEAALELGLQVYQPKKIREEESVEYLRSFQPDMIVVAAFGQILPKEILTMPKYDCINVHASLLPRYRGAAPIQWSILNGDEYAGVTIMRMDIGLDTGDMIEKVKVKIEEDETGGSLFDKLAVYGASLCVDTMEKIQKGEVSYTPQDERYATKVGMISKSFGHISWEDSAIHIERMVRGLNPWPSAYTYLNGKVLKIWKCKVGARVDGKKAGTVAVVNKKELVIQTGNGSLSLLEVQLEGKRRMEIEEFLRGYKIQEGMVLDQEKED